MNFQKRKSFILSLLDRQESVYIPELVEKMGVSDITVRRDLNLLSQQGLIIRTRGGAMSPRMSRDKIEFANKVLINQKAKEHIGRIAAGRLQDDDTVFLDCGSTVFAMAPFLRNKKIKVITNSIPLMYELLNSSVQINLIGGELDQERIAVHGSIALQHIERYKATKAFVGVDGVSLARGLTYNTEKEAEISLAMARHSEEVFLLCDSSKLEKDKYLTAADISVIDWLITDEAVSDELLQRYREYGVETILK
jgi:DeoR family transcriptional regulator, fructose operon transcriptional repressor